MRRRRDGSNSSSPERNKRTAVDSFSASKPFVLEPHHIWWTALVTLVFPYAELYSPEFVLNVLQVLFRETLDVRPASWEQIILDVCKEECGRKSREGEVLDFRVILHRYAHKLKDPMSVHKLMMEESKKIGLAGAQPGERFVATKRSWFGIYLRRCRLAYMKLSEAALTRLHKALMEWLDGESISYDLSTEIVEEPGYNLIPTFLDSANPGTTDSYECFEYDAHVGDVAGAVDNLRRYFDQRFTPGKQPPRQHVLNALVHYSLTSGEVEMARLMCSEAMNIARTVRDRRALMDVTSLARRLPLKALPTFHDDLDDSRRRQALVERDAEQAKLNPQRYTVIQQGTSPLDLLFDIRLGINAGESISFLFRKCFEAIGAFDLPPELHIWPLDIQWEIYAVDATLWRLAGHATVAEIGDDIVLRNTKPGTEIRLYTLCARARQFFQQGQYVKAFATLFDGETWSHLGLVQYQYWSNEVWHLMWDLATRRCQENFKRQFLEPRKPKVSPFETAETGKKSPEAIRKLIVEASKALTARDITRATMMIIDALHYAEVNHYWYLYRSAVPVFADLELQRGKIQSARHVLEQILPQVARGEDLEQRALVYTIYAKVKMAQSKSGGRVLLEDAIVDLKKAEADYMILEMHASVQDVLYLQAIVYEALGDVVERDGASRDLIKVEELEKMMMQELDTEMIELWDIVCEVGVAVASGDTHWP